MSDIIRLKHQPFVGKVREFEENTFSLAGSVWKTVERDLFSARRNPNAEIILNQLEVPVMMTEEGGSVGAFS
ncbi:MAG: hypothetical protein U0412_09235 [Nitrospira sp.]